MNDVRNHLDVEIQDLLDGRLNAAELRRVELHLADCERCRAVRDALGRVRRSVRGLPPAAGLDVLKREIVERLEGEPPRIRRLRRFGVAALLAAAAILAVVLLLASRRKDLPAAAASDFDQYTSRAFSLELATGHPELLEGYFSQRGVKFPTRVFDLSMMGYRLIGGRVHRLAGRTSALFVYRGPNDRTLLCEMFEGLASELPAGAERRVHNGIPFFLYRRSGRTEVFWPEGRILCVLVSDMNAEEVVQLAFAKAVKP